MIIKQVIELLLRNMLLGIFKISSIIPYKRQKPFHFSERQTKILLIIASGIGDALMATPLVHAIRLRIPNSYIHVVANRSNSSVFHGNSHVDAIDILRNKNDIINYIRLARKLRKMKFDLSLSAIPGNTRQLILLPFLAGAKFRIKHERSFYREEFRDFNFLFHRLVAIPAGRHRVDSNLDLLRAMGIELNGFAPKLFFPIDEQVRANANKLLKQAGRDESKLLIGFHPGCYGVAYGEKRWPWQKFAELGDRLQRAYNVQIVLVGGKEEIELSQKIATRMKAKPLILTGICNLKETAAIIEKCHLFVCNDSGLMHLAEAMDTAIVAIFGPTDERQIGPYDGKHIVVRNGKITDSVSVYQVMNAIQRLIRKNALEKIIKKNCRS